jgi:GT2 family glycosyltransferase
MTRVAVILLTMNQREKTSRCLESLRRVKVPEHRVFLWDNGSTDQTAEHVAACFPEVRLHRHPENLGVASGRNAAARLAIDDYDPTHLLFLDNDTTVEPEFLAELIAPFAADGRLAQTTPKIRCFGQPGTLYGAGGCAVRFWIGSTNHVGYGEQDRGQYDRQARCIASGGCMCVPAERFERLGGFDSVFDPYGPEDLDFGLRAVAAGYHGLYVPSAVIYHDPTPGRTFEGGEYTRDYASHRSRNWFQFMARHATPAQKLGFYLVGGPYRLARLLTREARSGNLRAALGGLARGLLTFRRSR